MKEFYNNGIAFEDQALCAPKPYKAFFPVCFHAVYQPHLTFFLYTENYNTKYASFEKQIAEKRHSKKYE